MIIKTNQLELRQLRYFVALADTLHYRKAAERLHISQSALSQQIKLLESNLCTTLLHRTNRSVSLSRSGELFLKEALLVLGQFDKSMMRWQSEISGTTGLLKVGFVGSAMRQCLPPILKRFTDAHSGIQLYLEELLNKEQLHALKFNTIDIGFMRSNRVGPEMGITSIFTEHFSVVLPKGHPIGAATFTGMEQLAEESFILFPNEQSPLYFQQILNLCTAHGFSPKISHRSIHGPTIFSLVENGMGISIVPSSLKDTHNYDVQYVDLVDSPYKTELFAVWQKNNDNPALSYFLDLLPS